MYEWRVAHFLLFFSTCSRLSIFCWNEIWRVSLRYADSTRLYFRDAFELITQSHTLVASVVRWQSSGGQTVCPCACSFKCFGEEGCSFETDRFGVGAFFCTVMSEFSAEAWEELHPVDRPKPPSFCFILLPQVLWPHCWDSSQLTPSLCLFTGLVSSVSRFISVAILTDSLLVVDNR